jgi:hypothetical protein
VTLLVVELVAGGAATELLAKKEVLDASLADSTTQGIPTEVRRVAGVRLGAHVDQHFDAVRSEQEKESVKGMARMADRKDFGAPVLDRAR